MRSARFLGSICGSFCALIWGGQAVVARLAAFQGLTSTDVAVLRFAVAGAVLLPIALRFRPPLVGQLGWQRGLSLFVLAGVPYNIVLVGGAAFAPATDSAAITFGVVLIVTSILAHFLLGQRLAAARGAALSLVVSGVFMFGYDSIRSVFISSSEAWKGHLMFVVAGVMWATFTVLSKKWNVDALAATATISVLSLGSLPFWIIAFPTHIPEASMGSIVMQTTYMGLLVGIASLLLYQRAIALLGPTASAMFTALAPPVACIGGLIVFAELPSTMETIGMMFVVAGLALAPFTSRPRQS